MKHQQRNTMAKRSGNRHESVIETQNELLFKMGRGDITKVPDPLTPMSDPAGLAKRLGAGVVLARRYKRVDVDFVGIMDGHAVKFDAKHCTHETRWSTTELKKQTSSAQRSQFQILCDFDRMGGRAFVLLGWEHQYRTTWFVLPVRSGKLLGDDGVAKSIKLYDIHETYRVGRNEIWADAVKRIWCDAGGQPTESGLLLAVRDAVGGALLIDSLVLDFSRDAETELDTYKIEVSAGSSDQPKDFLKVRDAVAVYMQQMCGDYRMRTIRPQTEGSSVLSMTYTYTYNTKTITDQNNP